MTPTPDIIDTPDHSKQEHVDDTHLEPAWHEDKEEHLRLEAEIRRLELRKLELQREMPGYDSHLRHDARFPDSAAEGADALQDGRLSLDGDEPPVR